MWKRVTVESASRSLMVVLFPLGLVVWLVGGESAFWRFDGLVDRVLRLGAQLFLLAMWLLFLALGVSLVATPFQAKGPLWKRGWGRALVGLVILYFVGVAVVQVVTGAD